MVTAADDRADVSHAPSNCRVAVPSPLRRLFDYRIPAGRRVRPGARVRVPFGNRCVIGVVVELADSTDVPDARLRSLDHILDEPPVIPDELTWLARWAADYYHHPPGEVFETVLPVRLRRGHEAKPVADDLWQATDAGRTTDPAELKRAPRQAEMLERLQCFDRITAADLAGMETGARRALAALEKRGLAARGRDIPVPAVPEAPTDAPGLSDEQARAVDAVLGSLDDFAPFLLHGVTGSGKTEVYQRVADRVLADGRQVLLLVPEISLTPQLMDRLRERSRHPVHSYHSGLSDGERLNTWLAARSGQPGIFVGTRSAVFLPLVRPGVFIVDEEHDASFKQHEGFRYSARDLAVLRARRVGVPALLGSATPSLESLNNVRTGRYRELRLPQRAGSATPPRMRLLDIRKQPLHAGLSPGMTDAIHHHLEAGGQVLLFLNRRGYAPILMCHDCGWFAECPRCDARMTYHQRSDRLRCHHCGTERHHPPTCPGCRSSNVSVVGQGTERIEEALESRFGDAGIIRIDRDTTRRKGTMHGLLERVRQRKGNLLVGTQMLAKGHDFPDVTLVGILDADQGLFSSDFRAPERMAQLIIQVGGRAGRAQRPGEVVIQTRQPEHPLLNMLVNEGYETFAEAALAERREALWPPFGHLAVLRAEAPHAGPPMNFLEEARSELADASKSVMILGPVPAPMERRAGRYRAQMVLQAENRGLLHSTLSDRVPRLESLKSARRVRWHLDVDPADLQ